MSNQNKSLRITIPLPKWFTGKHNNSKKKKKRNRLPIGRRKQGGELQQPKQAILNGTLGYVEHYNNRSTYSRRFRSKQPQMRLKEGVEKRNLP